MFPANAGITRAVRQLPASAGFCEPPLSATQSLARSDARSCVTPPDEHQSQLTSAYVNRRDNGVHGETLNSSVPCKPR